MIRRQLPDGTPYEIVEPDDPPRPAHDADICGQCTFVASPECIVVTPAQRREATITPGRYFKALMGLYDLEETIIHLGIFTMPQWSGHNTFWLFTCPQCQTQAVDYLHGYRLYLRCPGCKSPVPVRSDRFYASAGLPKLPSLREELAQARATIKRMQA